MQFHYGSCTAVCEKTLQLIKNSRHLFWIESYKQIAWALSHTMNFSVGNKQSNLIGIDISSTSVKLLELSRTKTAYRIESYAVEPLPANAMNDKSLQDIEAVGEAIKRALKRSGSKKKFAAVAVTSAVSYTHLTLPTKA